ncbi:MAG: DUF6428 family protein [Bacteroidota bacterium]
MTLSTIKSFLAENESILIQLPDGTSVPAHFHVTEIGEVTKNFIDCGGTLRRERKASFQLWNANDYDHRLHPEKLVKIIQLAERELGLGDLEIEVEYQGPDTIAKYGLEASANGTLQLTSTHTDCLANASCGVPVLKKKISLNNLIAPTQDACTPGGGCC